MKLKFDTLCDEERAEVMETLRDCQTSLVITAPERDSAARNGERGHESSTSVEGRSTHTGSDNGVRLTVVQNVSDRFSSSFTHPEFVCKPVPYCIAKRAFDILFASAILLISWPVMAVAALLIRLTSRGPVIFRQTRVGRGGRYFTCYKFRSMCADAEDKKKTLMHLNEVDGPVFKIKCDPRVTTVGAVLRKFSIDELPQLFNVLKGDMSVVGPRPPLPTEVDKYSERERGRLAVQPGLTCLWQISGRSNVSFERWVELDLLYIDNMSFMSDLGIVVKTVPAVLTGAGAH
jgi:exopolysaccharide biosynthesis polyprenyl glycosylphosphotransferase